jgi:hypothetical protein
MLLPRYHFHLRRDRDSPDNEGCELSGLDDARGIAARYLGALIADSGSALFNDGDWHLDVTDHRGLILFTGQVAGFSSSAVCSSGRCQAAASHSL